MLMVQASLDGILLGILFALIAYGMALQWGVMNIINIAQGDLVILGGYIATDVDYEEFKFKFGIIFCILSIFLFAWGTRETVILKEFSTIGRTTVTLYGGLIIVLICYFFSLILNPDFHRTGSFNISQLFILFIYTFPSAGLAQLFWIKGSEKLGVMFSTFHMNALPFYVMFFMIIFTLGD